MTALRIFHALAKTSSGEASNVLPEMTLDDDAIQRMLCDVLHSCGGESGDLFFSAASLVLSLPNLSVSEEVLRILLKIVENPKAMSSLKVNALRLLSRRKITASIYAKLEMDILQCVRQINAEDRWAPKLVALTFYESMLKDCAHLMFNRRVDFLWPVLEEYPPVIAAEANVDLIRYLTTILAGGSEPVVKNLMLTLDWDAVQVILKRFEVFQGTDVWFALILGLLRMEPIAKVIESDAEMRKSIRKHARTSDLAFITFAIVFGVDQMVKEFEGCDKDVVRLIKLIENRIGLGTDDFEAGFRLILPLHTVLEIIKTKPLEKIHHFTALFLQNNLAGKLVQEGLSRSDHMLLSTTVAIIFRLGFRSQDREALYKCLMTSKVHGKLDRLRSASNLSADERERLNEICSWKPRESPLLVGSTVASSSSSSASTTTTGTSVVPASSQLAFSVNALQQVTQCDAAICERLLRVNGVDLPQAINNFFRIKGQFPTDSGQKIMERLLLEHNGGGGSNQDASLSEGERPKKARVEDESE